MIFSKDIYILECTNKKSGLKLGRFLCVFFLTSQSTHKKFVQQVFSISLSPLFITMILCCLALGDKSCRTLCYNLAYDKQSKSTQEFPMNRHNCQSCQLTCLNCSRNRKSRSNAPAFCCLHRLTCQCTAMYLSRKYGGRHTIGTAHYVCHPCISQGHLWF